MSVRKITILVGSTPIGKAVTWAYPDGDPQVELFEIPTYAVTVSGTDNNGARRTKAFEGFRFGVQQKGNIGPRVVGLADYQTHKIKQWIASYEVHSAGSLENGAWQVYDNFLIHDGPDDPLDANQPYASIGCVEICNTAQSFTVFNDYILALSGVTGNGRNERLRRIGNSGNLVITYEKAARPALKPWTGP